MKRFLLVIAGFLFLPIAASAQSSFIVPVITTTGTAVVGVTVTVTCATAGTCNGGGPYSAITDANGNAQFTGVLTGTYTVTISGRAINTYSYTLSVACATCGAFVVTSSYSPTMAFPYVGGAIETTFPLQLTGNVASSSISGTFVQGNDAQFIVCQDGIGGRTFSWPSGFLNTPTLITTPSACTAATFVYCGPLGSGAACPANSWQNGDQSPAGAVTVIPGTNGSELFNKNGVFSGTSLVLKCDGFSGGNLGAQINACITAVQASSAGCGVADASDMSGTISTAVTIPACVHVKLLTTNITQTAGITMSGQATLECVGGPNLGLSKGANIDQVTLNGFDNKVIGCSFEGNKASFTGNGITIGAGSQGGHIIRDNVFDGEAGDTIKDQGTTFRGNTIEGNQIYNWGAHAYEVTGSSPGSSFTANTGGQFDCGATGAGFLLSGAVTVIGNNFQDCSAQILVDASGSNGASITGNTLSQKGGATVVKGSASTTIEANPFIQQTVGSTNPAIDCNAGCTAKGNVISSTNGEGIDGGNGATISSNIVNMNWSGVSSRCGIGVRGDNINVVVDGNQVTASDNAADVNSGLCNVPSGTHNLNINFLNNKLNGVLSGGANVFGFKLDNSANVNTNWALIVNGMNCVHAGQCTDRIDTQNNPSMYININPGDDVLDAGTGSTNDYWDLPQSSFANLPTPVGNGSIIRQCTDCTLGVAAATGGGASLVRSAGKWISVSTGSAPTISTHFNTSGDSISAPAGPQSFTITVGNSTGTSTGALTLPKSGTGWSCTLTNQSRADQIQQTASSTTSVTFTNFGTTFAATNWTNGDTLKGGCVPN